MKKIYKYLKVKDLTKVFKEDIEELMKYAVISYIGFLFIIPVFFNMHRKSKYMLFHINQGFNLFLIEIIIFIVLSLLNGIFVSIIGYTPLFISLTNFISYLFIVVLMLVSVVNTANGKSILLPIIGKYRFIKD